MDLDRKTIVAIAICVLFIVLYRPLLHVFGLDRYLTPAQQPVSTTAPPADTNAVSEPQGGRSLGSAVRAGESRAATPAPAPAAPSRAAAEATLFATPAAQAPQMEQTFEIETPLYRATFTNRGARLLSVELKHYASANGAHAKDGRAVRVHHDEAVPVGDRVALAGGPLFGLDLGSADDRRDLSGVQFAARESLDAQGQVAALTFDATDSSGAYVRQTYRPRPGTYAMDLEIEVRGVPMAWRLADYSLSVRSWPLLTEADELADNRSLRATSLVGTNLHREHAPRMINKSKVFDGTAAWAAVQSRYFAVAIAATQGAGRSVVSSATRRPLQAAEKAMLPPNAPPEAELAENTLVVALPSELRPVQHFVVYAGPTDYFQLAPLKLGLNRLVELGWAWVEPASKGLLWLLKALYGFVRNYGVAIILLATLVRLLLHPLNVTGIRNMRAMQRLQPELERIREKYKNDPQALNTSMMALYRENKVNPAGGCLPMLVQLPVFVALYNVLFNAIELRQAPFVAWIHDLSAPDLLFTVGPLPIRLLPLLMLGSGLLSQRLTPTDPRQLPTMYLMNAFMTVFFYNLPSGLVLYWTLMNVLTAVQQWLVLQQDKQTQSQAAVVEVAKSGRR